MNECIFVALFGIISISGFSDALVRPAYYITSSRTGDLYAAPNPVGTMRELAFAEINSNSPVLRNRLLVYFYGWNFLVPALPGSCFVAYVTFPTQKLFLETDPAKCKRSRRYGIRILSGLSFKNHFIYDSKTMLFLAPSTLRKVAVLSPHATHRYNLKPYKL